MNTVRNSILCLVAVLAAEVALAQGTYTQIDVPGAVSTQAIGINTAGDIVGSYQDSSNNYHGFLLSAGSYTTIDAPGSLNTSATGINDVGQIIGSSGHAGFLYDLGTQTFTEVKFRSNGSSHTTPQGINNAGTIVGFINLKNGPVGFEFTGGTFREVVLSGYPYSTLSGINNSDEALGTAFYVSAINFLFSQGQFFQSGVSPMDTPHGINDLNTIVGEYISAGNTRSGFLFQNGARQRLRFPGSCSTCSSYAYGINNAGDVVGAFTDASNITHGFLWTPSSDAATK